MLMFKSSQVIKYYVMFAFLFVQTVLGHVDKIAHSTEQSLLHGLRHYVNSTRGTACTIACIHNGRSGFRYYGIIRYVESGLTGHLNDAQTFGFYA